MGMQPINMRMIYFEIPCGLNVHVTIKKGITLNNIKVHVTIKKRMTLNYIKLQVTIKKGTTLNYIKVHVTIKKGMTLNYIKQRNVVFITRTRARPRHAPSERSFVSCGGALSTGCGCVLHGSVGCVPPLDTSPLASGGLPPRL